MLREPLPGSDHDPSVRCAGADRYRKKLQPPATISARSWSATPIQSPAQGNADDTFETVVNRWEALARVPTIAALQGSVYGGATDLALACDFRIGVEGMRMLMCRRPGSASSITRAVSSAMVSRLGVAAAKRLFLTAEPIEAEEMRRFLAISTRSSRPKRWRRASMRLRRGSRRQRAARACRAETRDQRDRRRRPARQRRARRKRAPARRPPRIMPKR